MSRADFEKLWKILICNYGGTHNEQKELIFHYLKDYPVEEVVIAIEKTIRNNRYFPNVNEILINLPNTQSEEVVIIPTWIEHPEMCISKELSEEEENEMKELLKEFGGTSYEIY